MHTIRRTTYWKFGAPITLAFVGCVGDEHPETVADAPAPTPPPPAKERRGPRPGRNTHKHLTDKLIRRTLGKPDPKALAKARDRVQLEATMKRIERGGV